MSELNDGDPITTDYQPVKAYTPTQKIDGTSSTLKRKVGTYVPYGLFFAGSSSDVSSETIVGTGKALAANQEQAYAPLSLELKAGSLYVCVSVYRVATVIDTDFSVQRYSLNIDQASHQYKSAESQVFQMNNGESRSITIPSRTINLNPARVFTNRPNWALTWNALSSTVTVTSGVPSVDWGTATVINNGSSLNLLPANLYEGFVGPIASSFFGPYSDSPASFNQNQPYVNDLTPYNSPRFTKIPPFSDKIYYGFGPNYERKWTFWNDYRNNYTPTKTTGYPGYLVRMYQAVSMGYFGSTAPNTTSSPAVNYTSGWYPVFNTSQNSLVI